MLRQVVASCVGAVRIWSRLCPGAYHPERVITPVRVAARMITRGRCDAPRCPALALLEVMRHGVD